MLAHLSQLSQRKSGHQVRLLRADHHGSDQRLFNTVFITTNIKTGEEKEEQDYKVRETLHWSQNLR